MDYVSATKGASALIGSSEPNEDLKRPAPSCMREHIDNLQVDVENLRKKEQNNENRISMIEKLVGM